MERFNGLKKISWFLVLTAFSLSAIGQGRVQDELCVLYNFNQSSGPYVNDISGYGDPLLLKIHDLENTTWLPGGGLKINTPTTIKSILAAGKITDAVLQTNELTMEVWVKPDNLIQGGPSRILSMSYGWGDRNMTLGQEGDHYISRVRTTYTSVNGNPQSDAAPGSVSTQLQHVVYTRDSLGNEKFYIDGVLISTGLRLGDFSGWSHEFPLVIANEVDEQMNWLGTIFLAATYSKALSETEILQNYAYGHLVEGPQVSTELCDNQECFVTGYGFDARVLWIPGLPNGVHHRFKFDENGGFFDVFDDGTAHLYGNTVNMLDTGYTFFMDIYFTEKKNWTEWSAMGRGWKGDPSIVGDLYQTWDYYIMDPNAQNVLIGGGNYEGVVLDLIHNPTSYYFGFQVGEAANAQNPEEGMSCWFKYSGFIDGQWVENSGDVNMEGECINLPVMDCLVDVVVDCDLGSDPAVTGTPVVNCEWTYSLNYWDEVISQSCPWSILRHWVATDDLGNSVECVQSITLVDENAPDIYLGNLVSTDCTAAGDLQVDVVDACSSVNYELTLLDSAWADVVPCDAGLFTAYSALDWSGQNATALEYLNAHFLEYFPTGLTVGCGDNQVVFTAPDSLAAFLATGSVVDVLPGGVWTNPGASLDNLLAARVVAATLNLGFDAADPNFGAGSGLFGELHLQSGNFAGYTVEQLLNLANGTLGTCTAADLVSLDSALSGINANFYNDVNNGFLNCSLPWSCFKEYQYEIVATDFCGNQTVQVVSTYYVDQTAPQLPQMDEFLTVSCQNIPDPNIDPVGNCPSESTTLEVSDVSFSGGCLPVIQRTWHLTDQCGNDTTFVQYITVVDQTAPSFEVLPVDTVVGCNDNLPVFTPVVFDNCDDAPTVDMVESVVDIPCGQEIMRTWTAVDQCGNSASVSQLITVVDDQPPYPLDDLSDQSVSCDNVTPIESISFADDCSVPTVYYSEIQYGSECAYTRVRNWTAVDACGNQVEYTQSLNVVDQTAPYFTYVPTDTTLSCSDSFPSAMPEYADNCSSVFVEEFLVDVSDGTGCSQWERTWVITDACGNQASASQLISVVDDQAPQLVGVPADYWGSCGDWPTLPNVTAVDNCDNNVEVTLSESAAQSGCTLSLVRTWTATDACGNASSQSQWLELSDVNAPQITGASEVITQCYSDINESLIEVVDDCGAELVISFSDNVIGGGCSMDVQRIWTATDACGNASTFEQLIHVLDETPPVFESLPNDLVLECGDPAPAVPELVVTDCGNVTVSFSESSSGDSCETVLTRTWVATDECGNQSSTSQSITFLDTTPPEFINFPADLNLSCTDLIPPLPVLDAVDNCDLHPTVTGSEMWVEGACPQSYSIVRTWTAVDVCGNETLAQQTIWVQDDTAPVFDQVLTDLVVDCGNIPTPPTVTASDNCGGEVVVVLSETTDPGGCPNVTRVWTATDACGNQAILTQQITVTDTEPPVISGVPPNTIADCNNIPEPATPEVTDNCDTSVDVVLTQNTVGSGCQYLIIRSWLATDDCGNTTIVSQSITVEDQSSPVFASALADTTLSCEALDALPFPPVTDACGEALTLEIFDQIVGDGCNYDVVRDYVATDLCGNTATVSQTIHVVDDTPPQIMGIGPDIYAGCNTVVEPDSAYAVDGCDGNVNLTFEEIQTGTGCNYSLTRIWTAVDACGNSTSATHMVYFNDDEAPVFESIAPDTSVECGEALPPVVGPTVSDNCTDVLSVDYIELSSSDGCGETVTRIWIATDACGNSAEASQVISIVDNVPPTISGVPIDTAVVCSTIPPVAEVVVSDNCSEVSWSFSESIIMGECPYKVIRTWVATDACGNTTIASQTIMVSDDMAPVLSEYPDDMIVSCGELPAIPVITASDDCLTDIAVVYEETQSAADCVSVLQRTWTATDYCGNTATHTQTIEIWDAVAPVFVTEPEDLVVSCENVPAMELLEVEDSCSEVGIEMQEVDNSDFCASQYTITRSWTATDACGNSTFIDQVIEVVDTLAPVLSAWPADTTVSCGEIPATAWVTVSDNCDENVELFYVEHTNLLEPETTDCELGNAISLAGDVAIWLPSLSGFSSNYVFGEAGGLLERNLVDGSAHLTGQVYDSENPGFSWIIDMYLYDMLDWEIWSANGGSYKDELGEAGDNYLDWDYYKLADGSTLTGVGYFDGSVLELTHAPANYMYGFQMGLGANNRNDTFGMSGWFYYNGEVMGYPVSGVGDLITENSCCPDQEISRTWAAVDCAGNVVSWTQVITVLGGFDLVPMSYSTEEVLMVFNSEGDDFLIQIVSPITGEGIIGVKDLSGHGVTPVRTLSMKEGEVCSMKIPKSGLSQGVYLVELSAGGAVYSDLEIVVR